MWCVRSLSSFSSSHSTGMVYFSPNMISNQMRFDHQFSLLSSQPLLSTPTSQATQKKYLSHVQGMFKEGGLISRALHMAEGIFFSSFPLLSEFGSPGAHDAVVSVFCYLLPLRISPLLSVGNLRTGSFWLHLPPFHRAVLLATSVTSRCCLVSGRWIETC